MSKAPPLLQINQLSHKVIGPVTLAVEAGDCVCISGPSGSGKSLLLRAIADLDEHAGEVLLNGAAARDIPAQLAQPGRVVAAGKRLVAAACR